MLVVDASIAVVLAVGEPGSDEADAMLEGAFVVAPELVLAETANAFWREARIGKLTRGQAAEASFKVVQMFDRTVPAAESRAQALDLALRRDHPAHGCFHVALAMREAAPLLTADRRLAQRFAGDVEVLAPAA